MLAWYLVTLMATTMSGLKILPVIKWVPELHMVSLQTISAKFHIDSSTDGVK